MMESDVGAYLTAFERTAKREGWPNVAWADLAEPFLLGPAQQAYLDLPTAQLKEELRGSMTGGLNQSCQHRLKCMTLAE